jgi:hypothetical protein
MIIRCTQKLLSELKIKPAVVESVADSFWCWHANVFYIERRKCVLVTNDKTLFCLFIPSLKKPDFQSFHYVFGQFLFKNLLYEQISQNQIETVLDECREIHYGKTNNRSVLGSMNDQRFQLECFIESMGGLAQTDVYELNHHLNRSIMGAIKYKHPIEMFSEQLNLLLKTSGTLH